MSFFSKRAAIITAYAIALLFIISGAVNYGFTRFWLATPFMVLALHITRKILNHKALTITTVAICVLAIAFNETLEYNPLIFPILNNGFIKLGRDGYVNTFGDGSALFTPSALQTAPNQEARRAYFKAGEAFKVQGVVIDYPEFGTEVSLQTPICRFMQFNIADTSNNIEASKPIEQPWIKNLGAAVAKAG